MQGFTTHPHGFAPLAVSLLIAVIHDLRAYLRCRKYSRQAFALRYRFLAGIADLFLPDRFSVPDIMSRYKRVLGAVRAHPGLVMNSNPRGRAVVYLTDPSLVHEFFLKEHHFTRKHEFNADWKHYNDYFPFMRGPLADEERNAFKDFFSRTHLAEILGFLHKDIKNHINSVENRAKDTGNRTGQAFTADWKDPNYKLLFLVANTVIFGQSDHPVKVQSEGSRPFGEMVKEYLEGPYRYTKYSLGHVFHYCIFESKSS